MIDWNEYKQADRAVVRYFNDDELVGKQVINRPTQTKTVADTVEQEGEKWTNVDSDGNECRILHTIGDHSWVTYKNNSYEDELWPNVELRVIKPTISEAESWRKAVLAGSMQHITDNYNVVKD